MVNIIQKNYTYLLARLVIYVVCFGGLIYYLYHSPYNPHPRTAEDIRIWVANFGVLAPLIYVGIYTVRPLLLFPTIFLNLSAGVLFGPWLGIILVLTGGLGCACLCYSAGRFGGGRWLLDNFGGSWGERLRAYLVGSESFMKMLWLRTVPIFPYDPVSVVAGSVLFPIKTYVIATIFGMLPGAVAYNFLADAFGTSKFYAAIGVTVLAFGIPLVLWRSCGESAALAKYAKGVAENEKQYRN